MTKPTLETATQVPSGFKGRIVDLVTLEAFDIRYEPQVKDEIKPQWGFHSVFGNTLPVALWAGGGEKAVTITVHLLGVTVKLNAPVSPQTIGQARMDALASYQRMIPVKVGTNPDGSDKFQYVKNPQPPPAVPTIQEAQKGILDKRKAAAMGVLDSLNKLERLTQPQDDIGAPHPVLFVFGSIYPDTKFVIESLSREFLSYAQDSQIPYEAKVTLKLRQVQFDANTRG